MLAINDNADDNDLKRPRAGRRDVVIYFTYINIKLAVILLYIHSKKKINLKYMMIFDNI